MYGKHLYAITPYIWNITRDNTMETLVEPSSTGSSQNFMWILFGGRLPGLVNVYKKLKHMV